MAGNHDERPFFDGERDGRGLRRAVGLRIRAVQQFHALEVHAPGLHHQRQQFLRAHVLANGKHPPIKEPVHFRVGIPQHAGVVRIGRHPAQAEEQERFQGFHVGVRLLPELLHVVVVVVRTRAGTAAAPREQLCLFRMDRVDLALHGLRVKAYIGDRGEQPFQHGAMRGFRGCVAVRGPRQADQRAGQLVLQSGHLRIFAADAARPRAARAAGRLFTLGAKHLLIHRKFLRSFHAPVPAYRERTSPLVASTTTCQGIILPLCCKARLTAFSIPPQQGTSMRTTVTLWMSFCRRISVSFSA